MAIARLTASFELLIRTVKAAHVSRLDFPRRRQAIKITRCGRTSPPAAPPRQTVYAVTSPVSLFIEEEISQSPPVCGALEMNAESRESEGLLERRNSDWSTDCFCDLQRVIPSPL